MKSQIVNGIKKIIPRELKLIIRKGLNSLIPGENIKESKDKWNRLAENNPRYIVFTDLGEGITEEEFKNSGEKDYENLIQNDEIIKNRLGNFKDKAVLEIGCGMGRVTEFIARNFKKVTAIDISEKMIAEGKNRLKNFPNVEFFANDGLNYPAEDSSIDFVFSYIVFQHMSNKKVVEKNLSEVKRVLSDNGIAKIQVRGLPTSKLNWFYGPSFNKKEIEGLLNSLGLKIIKLEGENQR